MINTLVKTLGKVLFKIAFFIILPVSCFAQNIIRDSEIERVIYQIANPVIRAAGLKPEQFNIYIINDNTVNAFTPGNKEIYIHSGLLKTFDNPDVIRAVIAHEIGHIVGGHRPSQAQKANEYSMAAMGAMGLGLAVAGVFKDFSPGFAIALGGVHYAERSVLYYSRIDESIADKSALRFLEASGNTSKGLIILMDKLYAEHRGLAKYISPYDMTHPLSEARLASIKRFYALSKHKTSSNGESLIKAYKRAVVKLKAFTDDPDTLLKSYYYKNDDLIRYAKAIIYFRKSNKTKALHYIDELLVAHPEDPYFNELKGQILFEFGSKEAMKYYDHALAKLPNDTMLQLSNAIVRLNVYSANEPELKIMEKDLKHVLNREKNNLTALYYEGIYYDKIGQKSKSLLAMALFFSKKGEAKKAKSYAKQAIKGLAEGSPEWYQAKDIIDIEV